MQNSRLPPDAKRGPLHTATAHIILKVETCPPCGIMSAMMLYIYTVKGAA